MPNLTREARRQRDFRIRALKAQEVKTKQLRLVAKGIHLNRERQPLEFSDHYFMRRIYEDAAPELAIQSSVQTGKTEYLISYGKACVDAQLSVLHALPKYESRNTFVGGRIDPLLEDVPEYRASLRSTKERKSADNKSIKLFVGGGVWRFVGSNVRTDFKEFSADVFIADEWDEFDMENAVLAEDRLEASLFKFKRWCGNPTVPGYGINVLFKRGTQNEMHYQCTKCERWQRLDFFEAVAEAVGDVNAVDYRLRDGVEATDEFACSQCGAPLNRDCWKWIPLFTKGAFPSYHISKLMVRSASPKALWAKFQRARTNDTDLAAFFNSDLGIPFEQAGSAVTENMIRSVSILKVMPRAVTTGWCTMGVDVGAYFDVRVSKVVQGIRCCVHLGRYLTIEELLDLIPRYRVRVAVVDALPETRKMKEFQDAAAKRGCDTWLCRFKGDEGRATKLTRDEVEREFSIDRTYALDMASGQIRDKKNLFPINAAGLFDGWWISSMTVNKRVLHTDARGNRVYRWTKSDHDHARFADVYDLLALELFGAPAVEVQTDPQGASDSVLVRGATPGAREFMAHEGGDVEGGALRRSF